MEFFNFNVPASIDGNQLKTELGGGEVYVREGKLVIGSDLTKDQVSAIIAAHVPAPKPILTPRQKLLERTGLTAAELKTAIQAILI